MSAIITLKQADFSANNIGRVAIMGELTKKVLAKQTQYSEDGAEAAALDTFLAALTSNGFIGGDNPKLSVLMIPALAGKNPGESDVHDQLFFNICKLDANGAPTNWMPAYEATTPIYHGYKPGDYNIGAYASAAQGQVLGQYDAFGLNLGTYFQSGQKMPSFCLFNYLVKAHSNVRPIAQYNYSVEVKCSPNNCKAGVSNSDRALFTTEMTTTPKGFYGMAYDGASGAIIIDFIGTTTGTSTPFVGGVTLGNPRDINVNFPLIVGNTTTSGAVCSAIMGFGTGLTQSELATLKGLCDTFAAALHISI